jgi:hypothetical protein
MHFKHLLVSSSFFIFAHTLFPLTNVTTTKHSLLTILKREQPACVEEFTTFFRKYDEVVSNFFDRKNNDPLKKHVEIMEIELQTLKKVGENEKYKSIKIILEEYYTPLRELITLLKRYSGSQDTLSLALEIRKYKPLLPESLQQQGSATLFSCLRHRLKCGK